MLINKINVNKNWGFKLIPISLLICSLWFLHNNQKEQPTSLFVTDNEKLIEGSEQILQFFKKNIAETLVSYADPFPTFTPLERIKEIGYPKTLSKVDITWLKWAHEITPNSAEITRLYAFWTLQQKGPKIALTILEAAITKNPQESLLLLDLAGVAEMVPSYPKKSQLIIKTYHTQKNWKGWEQTDVAKLCALLSRDIQNKQQRISYWKIQEIRDLLKTNKNNQQLTIKNPKIEDLEKTNRELKTAYNETLKKLRSYYSSNKPNTLDIGL